MRKLLELQSVTAGYDENIILKEIELSVYERDFLGIIGPNGSGKSTLLKLMLGLIPPMRGTVKFFPSPGNEKNFIGYLPQINAFDKKFPIVVMDVVLAGLISKVGMFKHFSKEDRKRAEQILDEMGILSLKKRPIGELSGGQMQRVFLCRALISSPQVLLLDEPSTFVDSHFEIGFYEILKKLNQEKAIVLVSHDMGTVLSHVKNIACLNQGKVTYHSSSEVNHEVLEDYHCPVEIIAHGDIPHRVLKSHEGGADA